MNILFASCCLQGMRDENQDRTGNLLDEQKACFLVCDGVAGLPGGELAAELVRDTLLQQLHGLETFSPQSTASAIDLCQQQLLNEQRNNPKFSRMSTTLAALFIDRVNQQAWWAHAGDSRVYHFRQGTLKQVTRDHSLVQQLKEAGYENTGINSNLLYNALGLDRHQPASFSETMTLADGDAFLVCTDGFWLHLASNEMEQALRMVNACDEWLTLMQGAVSRTTQSDNLSAIAVWVGAPQEVTLLWSPTDSARFLPTEN